MPLSYPCMPAHSSRRHQRPFLQNAKRVHTVVRRVKGLNENMLFCHSCVARVGQNCLYMLYMTVNPVISLPELPYIHRMQVVMANPTYGPSCTHMRTTKHARTRTRTCTHTHTHTHTHKNTHKHTHTHTHTRARRQDRWYVPGPLPSWHA